MKRIICAMALAASLSFACGDDDGGGGGDASTNGNDSHVPEGCGNGIQEGAEQCDDGTANSDTEPNACRSNCSLPSCGDGVVDDDDECDDGTANSDDEPNACRTTCAAPACGDGVIDTINGEQCDDGAANSDVMDANCRTSCQLGGCGDGILDTGEQCDDGPGNSDTASDACRTTCLDAFCGDNALDTGEICDDGNDISGDGCAADCLSDESCGNQIVDTAAGEQCDDGNHLSHDSCSSGCTQEAPIWIQRTPANRPPARIRHTMVYDSTRGRTVMHGGWTASLYYNDTWSYDGNNWHQIVTANAPPPRQSAAMAYDPVRDRVVLFGGFYDVGTDVYRNDTWEFDGTNWSQRFPAVSPGTRLDHAMAYDPSRGAVVLFGGEGDGSPRDYGDTWEWNGTSWTMISNWSTVARTKPAMVWDAGRSRLVMHGGTALNTVPPLAEPKNDTWEYGTLGWQLVSTTNSPPLRSTLHMAYDSNRGRVVLFGGSTSFADTWEYDGTDWTGVIPTASPEARDSLAMVYDVQRRRCVIFGGLPYHMMGHLDETWEYWETSTWPDEQCANGVDDDSDGDVDCADPDCDALSCATGTCIGGVCQ